MARVYPPRPARISEVHAQRGATVAAGDPLVSLRSDELEHDIRVVRTEMARIKAKLARLTADQADRENSAVSQRELAALTAKHHGLLREQAELVIKSPISGNVVELNPDLHTGRTISQKEMVALIGGERGIAARGYVAEKDLWRLENGDEGWIIPENEMRPSLRIKLRDVSLAGARQIEIADLASVNGGKIAVQTDSKRQLVPVAAHYAVTLAVDNDKTDYDVRFRGVAQIKGKAESFAAQIWREVARVLIRESGA
jgi:putative peptide zinc metalloprotease protein